jgi:glycosyltransferase involved in cell wall biosynthesis
MNERVSAYIPCFNNARTISLAVEGIRNQTRKVDELFVVDDGSTDNSVEVVEGLGVRVVRLGANRGRGAVRARAMEEAQNELVLCCDATNRLAPNFLEQAVGWFSEEGTCGVVGRLFDRNPKSAVDRWRARHLFKQNISHRLRRQCLLSTYGAVLRKSSVLRVGNYDANLRHGEDYELGLRLSKDGDIVFDPKLEIEPVTSNTLIQVMERYSRWNRAGIKAYTLNNLLESHIVAWKILIPDDVKQGDWASACISVLVPYFSFAYADKKSMSLSVNEVIRGRLPTEKTKPLSDKGGSGSITH